MKLDALLSTVILVSFLVTIMMAVGSYFAYKLREARRPQAASERATAGALAGDARGPSVFFEQLHEADLARPTRAPHD